MKLGIKQIILVIVLLTFVVFIQACTGTSEPQAKTQTTTKDEPPVPSAFETADLAINPAEVYPGVEVIITAQVTNMGDNEAIYAAGLRLDDETVATEEITITAGASQPVSFIGAISTPGTYKVTWTERVGEFLVPRLTGELVVVGDESADSSVSNVAAPDFTAVDVVTGETISLSQFSGSTILLNFVNYGCNPSTNKVVGEQLLAIRELREQRDDFVPISVFCGCCPVDVLRDFATQNQLTWPWILDTDYSIVRDYARHLRKYGYPTLIFINEEQQIREVSGYCDVSTLATKIEQT
jgi:hypothetical protein